MSQKNSGDSTIKAGRTVQSLSRELVLQMLASHDVAAWSWDLGTDRFSPVKSQHVIMGTTDDGFHPTSEELLALIHAEDRPQARQWLDALRNGEAVSELRYRAVGRSGQLRDYLAAVHICIGSSSSPKYLLGTLQNVTKQTQMWRDLQHKQGLLLQLAHEAHSSASPIQTLQQIIRRSRQVIDADQVTVSLLEPDNENMYRRVFVDGNSNQVDPEEKAFSIDDIPDFFNALQQDRIVAVVDTASDVRVAGINTSYLKPRNIRALLSVLVLHDGKPIGILAFEHHHTPRRWKLTEQQFTLSIADLLTTVFERRDRQEFESTLIQKDLLINSMLNNAPSIITIKDPEGRYLVTNRNFEKTLRISSSQAYAHTDHELLPEALANALSLSDTEVLESQQFLEKIEYLPMPDGERAYLTTKFPLFNPTGSLYGTATISRDVTEYEHTFQRLRESEARLRVLAETPFDAIIVHDSQRILEVNNNTLKMYGYDLETILNMYPFELVAPQDGTTSKRHAGSGLNTHYETWCKRSDGSIFPVEVKGRSANLDGVAVRVVAVRDLTEQRKSEQALRDNEERYKAFIAASSEAIWRADLIPPIPLNLEPEAQQEQMFQNAVIVESNKAMAKLHGFERPEDTYGLSLSKVYEESIFRGIALQFIRCDYAFSEVESPFRNRKGELIWIQGSYFGAVEDGHLHRVWCIQRDVTERRRHIAELEYQTTHDALTDLYNRKWLSTTIDTRINSDPDTPFALIFIDLNHFKEINDTLGHHTGDLLLTQVGPRIKPLLDEADLVRLGGDEFAVLINDTDDLQYVQDLAQSIIDAIRQPFAISGLRLEIGASAGIAQFPQHGQDSSTLMRCADIAMYLAKKDLLGWTLYQPSLDEYSPRRLALMSDLGMAMRENQLFLVYQPKVELQTGTLTGFEALLRWRHPTHGNVPPNQFIPLAEMSDIIHPLTDWVMERALMQLHDWREQGLHTSIAINVSPRNLLNDQYPDSVQRLLQQYQLPPSVLQLEITESALISDPEKALVNLQRIHALGVKLAIDDYGTGYSSLAYLKRMPVDTLKIDISFTSQMLHNHADAMIVRSTIALAQNLGLVVVAEGVEDSETLEALRAIGCDEAQGYHIARPMPADEATERMTSDQLLPL